MAAAPIFRSSATIRSLSPVNSDESDAKDIDYSFAIHSTAAKEFTKLGFTQEKLSL